MATTEQQPALFHAAPTLAEYLAAAVGRVWTAEDSLWIARHIRAIEELAERVVKSAKGRR